MSSHDLAVKYVLPCEPGRVTKQIYLQIYNASKIKRNGGNTKWNVCKEIKVNIHIHR